MGQTDLARPRHRSSTHQCGGTARVMRGSERRHPESSSVDPETGCGSNHGHFKGPRVVERRKDPGQPSGQHRLAASWRAAEEQVVSTGRRDLDRPDRHRLSHHPGKPVVPVDGRRHDTVLSTRSRHLHAPIGHEIDDLDEMPDPEDRDTGHHGSLGDVVDSHDDAVETEPACEHRHGDGTSYGSDRSVERELTTHQPGVQTATPVMFGTDLSTAGQRRHRDRKVVDRALLPPVGRRKVDRQTALRPGEAPVSNGGPHSLR